MLGTQLGSYRLKSKLGTGGMGTVYLATAADAPDDPGKRVAVKLLHPHLLSFEGLLERFRREAAIGRRVEHENVVRIHGVEEADHEGRPTHFLVMEYVEGQTLRDLLAEFSVVPEELCRHIAREVAKGLGAVHDAGAIHRDLKPENILITRDHVVKVMDLGMARPLGDMTRLSEPGAFVGSVQYAAPEQFRSGGSEVDARADLYALGRVLYELATGRILFSGLDVAAIVDRVLSEKPRPAGVVNPQLSPFFEEVIHCLLEKEREARFGDAAELVVVLADGEDSRWWHDRATSIRTVTRKPLRRIRVRRETALYGREEEMETLRDLFERSRAGEGQVLLVEGEAGIGKTRLVDEFVAGLSERGEDVNFLFGGYPPAGAATAAGAFSTAFREHFGGEALTEILGRYLTETSVLIPAFAALLRGEPAPEGTEPLTKDSIHAVFLQSARALAAERPTIVLIDDLHYAPEEGRSLFAALAVALARHRVLLVGTARHGAHEGWLAELERIENVTRIGLSRLGPKDLTRLLVEAFDSERLAEELGFRIAVKSDGNPYFVFEIIRSLRDHSLILQTPEGTWVISDRIRNIELPSSVLDLIQLRIAALERDERELLDVAACCGFEFDATLVAEALRENRIPTIRQFAHMERVHRLVRSAGRGFVFDHDQIRGALYESLPEVLREAYHAALGESLEKRLAGAPGPVEGKLAVDLCQHFLCGGKGEKSVEFLWAALEHLASSHLNGPLVELADDALGRAGVLVGKERAEVILMKAGKLELLGRLEEEEWDLREALRTADEVGGVELGVRVRQRLAGNQRGLGRVESAMGFAEDALELAQGLGDPARTASVQGSLGSLLADQGRFDEAVRHYEEELRIGLEIGDRLEQAKATGNLAVILWETGKNQEALERYQTCLALFRELGDRRGEGAATGNLGLVFYGLSRYKEAREHFERHLEISRDIGYQRGVAMALGNLGMVCQALGRLEEAREHYERDLAMSRDLANPRHEAVALGNLGHLCLLLGDLPKAGDLLEASLVAYVAGDWPLGAAAIRETLGSYEGARGRDDLAEEHLRQVLGTRERLGASDLIASVLLSLGRLHVRLDRVEEGRDVLQRALHLAQEAGNHPTMVLAACHSALLPGGDAGAAREFFEAYGPKLDLADRMEAEFVLWRVTGEWPRLDRARDLLDELRAHAPEGYRKSMVENVPLHRDITAAWEGRPK